MCRSQSQIFHTFNSKVQHIIYDIFHSIKQLKIDNGNFQTLLTEAKQSQTPHVEASLWIPYIEAGLQLPHSEAVQGKTPNWAVLLFG